MNKKKRRFKRLIEPHTEKLYRAAYRLTGSQPDAEDLLQETLLKAYRSLDRLTDESNPAGWVYTILKNSFLNALKKKERTPQLLYNPERLHQLPANDQTDEEGERDFDDQLQSALMGLPDDMRFMLVAREIEGLTYQEIATMHGLTLGTVKSRINRGRERLRRLYLKEEEPPDRIK